jgi:DNA-binding CsgD family transcriptional regulator
MISVAEELEREEKRRDREEERVRAAVRRTFAVGGDPQLCLLRSDVHQVVKEALDLRLLRPPFVAFINDVVQGMGAELTRVGGRPAFAAVRRLDVPLAQARQQSTALRRRLTHRGKDDGGHGDRGDHGATRRSRDTLVKDWEARLQAEGLPAELDPIRRGGSIEHVANGSDMPVKREGVHRQPPGARAAILASANERTTDLLAEVELEAAVLRLQGEGLSIRKIGVRLDLHRSKVDRILRRIAKRLGSEPMNDNGDESTD